METQYSSNYRSHDGSRIIRKLLNPFLFCSANHKLIEDHLFSLTLENIGEKIVGLESEFSWKNFSNQSNLMLFVRFPRLVEKDFRSASSDI